MTVWPLRFREIGADRLIFADDAGGFFYSDGGFLERYAGGRLTAHDTAFLHRQGHAFTSEGDLAHTAFSYRWATRQNRSRSLGYLILVPTLRCNLACTYCQVSRAAETATGYDWSPDVLRDALAYIDRLQVDDVKIEFQGGEPFLRTDLLEEVRSFCRSRFTRSEFVVCTNLQRVGPRQLDFVAADDTHVSTSIDGALADHDRQRTQNPVLAAEFFANLAEVRRHTHRLSALPTIDLRAPPDLDALIDLYEELGLRSIYLRPVNYQGFARRRSTDEQDATRWNAFYLDFIERLIDRNFTTGRVMEEYYFSHCLRRVLRAGEDGHVDLRNPALFGTDNLVIDYDGALYPSDEARMLARVGHVDLSIGDVRSGLRQDVLEELNGSALNNFDPDCIHCPYQPFCGSDLIDDLSRYRRVDMPRGETWFCQRQLAVFDRIMRLFGSADPRERFSLRHWAGVSAWHEQLAPVHHDTAAHPC